MFYAFGLFGTVPGCTYLTSFISEGRNHLFSDDDAKL